MSGASEPIVAYRDFAIDQVTSVEPPPEGERYGVMRDHGRLLHAFNGEAFDPARPSRCGPMCSELQMLGLLEEGPSPHSAALTDGTRAYTDFLPCGYFADSEPLCTAGGHSLYHAQHRMVRARVLLDGLVRLHEHGYRAQYMAVEALLVPAGDAEHKVWSELAERYDCKIEEAAWISESKPEPESFGAQSPSPYGVPLMTIPPGVAAQIMGVKVTGAWASMTWTEVPSPSARPSLLRWAGLLFCGLAAGGEYGLLALNLAEGDFLWAAFFFVAALIWTRWVWKVARP